MIKTSMTYRFAGRVNPDAPTLRQEEQRVISGSFYGDRNLISRDAIPPVGTEESKGKEIEGVVGFR
jgi:hypothetical protein